MGRPAARWSGAFASLMLALPAGCATLPPPAAPAGGLLITYEMRCNNSSCDPIKLALTSDGLVWMEQRRFFADNTYGWVGRRQVRVSPERLATFRRLVDPWRPEGRRNLDNRENCQHLWSESDRILVHWTDGTSESDLLYDFGCDEEVHRAMREALTAAPGALGIEGLPLRPRTAQEVEMDAPRGFEPR